ncbi:MAG TPA: ATP-binding protein [Pyrinomonadaceae bacterium]|nr:ATP-binding protein [Pyrinomonadaceae bacterium]
MNHLQADFLKRSIAVLENLAKRAETEKNLSPEFVRETFRALHTIKGTARTFGFSNSSKIAHELENLLSGNDLSKETLVKGFADLANSLAKADKSEAVKSSATSKKTTPIPLNFDHDFLEKFSEHEKKIIFNETAKGKKIYLVNVSFEMQSFAAEFKSLREKMSENGEIIAVFPYNQNGKIGFQICFAFAEAKQNLDKLLEKCSGEIIEQKPLSGNSLDEILAQIKTYAEELAEELNKQVEIEIFADKLPISAEKSGLIIEILTHLTRNALDHAFASEGKLQITAEPQKDGLILTVKDNGKGIDIEKLKNTAIKKKLISPDKILTTRELIDLIFIYDFSTAETLTEISGRGIGLNAVKKLAENAGGFVHVKSHRKSGTTFEVFLRYEK